jgi:bacterioferritin-associated ferredoxin
LAAVAVASRLRPDAGKELQQRGSMVRAELHRQLQIRPFLDALYRPADSHRMPTDDAVIVCRCEEVTAGQIRQYTELGCQGPNQTKAFGRCGMGPCQGRLCGLTVTELLAQGRGVSPEEVGYYRIRPPIKPVTLGELAGF